MLNPQDLRPIMNQSRFINTPKLGQSVIEEPLTNRDHIHCLRKLYFMMSLCYLIALFNYFDIGFLNTLFTDSTYWIIILLIGCITLSIIATNSNNSILYFLFTILFFLLFASIKANNNNNVMLMILFMFGGQVLAQFVSVLQADSEKDLHFHQQALFILFSGLIVFQLFITCFDVKFFEMIIILVSGIVFGFCLVVENRNILEGNALPECVAIYVKIIEHLLKKAYLIAQLYYKDPIDIQIKLIERNKKYDKQEYRKVTMEEAKQNEHILKQLLGGGDGLIGLSNGMFILKKGRCQYVDFETEECTNIAIMK